ncbi:MAG: GFA family protein [Steroidobacteraceae bacterium]
MRTLGPAYYYHCSRCRKVSGSAFTANAIVSPTDVVVTQGSDRLRSHTTADGTSRSFCGDCGSPLLVRQGNQMRLRLGCLDTPIPSSARHIFVGSKANWYAILDELPQYDERP